MNKHVDINTRLDSQESPFSSSSSSCSTLSDVNCSVQNLTEQLASTNLSHSRYLPQTQAILTTEDNWKITVVNPTAHQLFQKDLLGEHVLETIDPDHRPLLLDHIVKAREENKSPILVSGYPVPILESKIPTILWLKEKKKNGSSMFIWIFEQVCQSTIKITMDKQKTILNVEEGVVDLFDYSASQLSYQSIHHIIPHYEPTHTLFTGCSRLGASFPVIACGEEEEEVIQLRITSIPTLSGLLLVNSKGMIEECSDMAFAKYLFGTHILHEPLSYFIPQFSALMTCLERDDLLQNGVILHSHICRSLLSTCPLGVTVNRKPSTTPAGKILPIIVAVHRDGTYLEIDLRLQPTHRGLSVWISFDRQTVLSRYGHRSHPIPHIPKSINQRSQSINLPIQHSTHLGALTYSAQSLKTNIKDYEIVNDLGQGTYGIVKLAYLKKDIEKKKVVIKYVYKSRVLIDCWTRDKKLGLVPVEIHVLHTLKQIPHVNCSDMLDYFEDQDHYYVVMDLFGAGMDLFDYIEFKKEGLSEVEIRLIFRQIIQAVVHLHDHQIVHRDIKDENVILDLEGGVRLIDFGSATFMKEGESYDTFVGTLDYAAPEVLRGKPYAGPPQDIWACGTLLYTLIYRETPFYSVDEIMERELRLPFVLSQESVDLVRKMLERDVDKRLTAHQVLAHPWLQSK